MAKTKDKIPAKVRQQREAAEALGKGGNGDASDILKQLEQEKAEAFAKLEADFQAKREKAVEKQLEPLRKRRDELDEQIRTAEAEQADIDRQIADLTGTKRKVRGGAGGGGKRQRPDPAVMDALLAALPSDDFMSLPDAMTKAKLSDREAVNRAVARLKRDGKIKSNGKVGPRGGWQKAA